MNISILADSVESLIGALYLDGGFKNAKKFIKSTWGPYFDIEEKKVKLNTITKNEYLIKGNKLNK